MESNRSMLYGILRINESIYRKNIYLFGLRLWKVLYFANTIEHYLFGRVKITTKKHYPLKVSVVMHACNSGKCLRESIDSIVNQTFTDFEFIIINDASTDSTKSILLEYKDKRIVLIDNEEKIGFAKSFILGIGLSRGEYIARMDPGDVSSPDRLAKQADFMDKHEKVGILGCLCHIFGSSCKVENKPRYVNHDDMTAGSPMNYSTIMLRKSLFNKSSLHYEIGYEHCENPELFYRIMNFMKIANVYGKFC